MDTPIQNSLIIASIAIPLAAIIETIAVEETLPDTVDAHQANEIWAKYFVNRFLHADDIKVLVQAGTATLTGMVAIAANKELANAIALTVVGISHVDNQIVVQEKLISAAQLSDRNTEQMINDANTTATIKAALMQRHYGNGLTTNVDTTNQKVTLTGHVNSLEAKEFAGLMASKTRDVACVDNQLEVTPISADVQASVKTATHDARRDIADNWISTKVRSDLLCNDQLTSSGIVVSTCNGIVTLSGKAVSIMDRSLAIKVAQKVHDVRSVEASELKI